MDMKTMKAFVVVAALVLGGCASKAEAPDAPGEDSDERAIDVETDTATPAYGSTFNSNCYCLACTKYCTVDGTTYKSGTCC
jgi:hypothetical protein